MKKEIYIVELERPKGVSIQEMRDYIKDAIQTTGSCFNPDENGLFGGVSCKVKRMVK